MANYYSGGNRELKQTATMLLPGITVQRRGLGDGVTGDMSGCIAIGRCMRTRMIVVIPDKGKLPLQVSRIPE